MQFTYGQYDGNPFATPNSLFPPAQVVRLILQYGEEALDAMGNPGDEAAEQLIEDLIESGYLEREPGSGRLRMTPKMVQGIEHRAMLEIFHSMQRGAREGHEVRTPGHSDERSGDVRPYRFGDTIGDIDAAATMRNALHRRRADQPAGPLAMPLGVAPKDFEVHVTEGQADAATCVLLDLSGSMMRYGRFFHAKRVALGMRALIRKRFPLDSVDFVGFYSLASTIREQELPLVMPKPVSLYDPQVRLRIPLPEAQQKEDHLPLHFTNLQLGLRLARQTLARRGAANKQVFIITDGQPTAHVEPSATGDGEMLYMLYPPTERTAEATLKEALRCVQAGVRIATFALTEDYWDMDWLGFVDRLTRLTRGAAFHCASDDLSSIVFESYLSGKRQKKAFV